MTHSMIEKMAAAIEPLIRNAQPIYGWDEREIVRAALSVLRNASTGKPVTDHVIRAYVDEILGEGEKVSEGG